MVKTPRNWFFGHLRRSAFLQWHIPHTSTICGGFMATPVSEFIRAVADKQHTRVNSVTTSHRAGACATSSHEIAAIAPSADPQQGVPLAVE